MPTREVPRHTWADYFDRFSRQYRGWLVSLEVIGRGGHHASSLPLRRAAGVGRWPLALREEVNRSWLKTQFAAWRLTSSRQGRASTKAVPIISARLAANSASREIRRAMPIRGWPNERPPIG